MSILRLSVLKDTAYAPLPDGTILMEDYAGGNKASLRGRLDTLVYEEGKKDAPAPRLRHYLERSLAKRTKDLLHTAPVIVMVHGFLFDPRQAISEEPRDSDNPHARLYHFHDGDEAEEQRYHTSSWPLHLGFSKEDKTGKDGLALAFGWHSQPGFAQSLLSRFQNFYARAYDYGGLTAWVLVRTVELLADQLKALDKANPIDIFCHSLGSRVVIRALQMACKDRPELIERLGRVVILGGAEYVVEAQIMMSRLNSLNSGTKPDVYNFVSRENDVLDKLGENFGPNTFGDSQVVGHNGLTSDRKADNWTDLQIDSGELQDWMKKYLHFDVSGDRPDNIWDHWYYYTFRGNMKLYKSIFRERNTSSIKYLRGLGDENDRLPEGVKRRWYDFGD